MIFTNETNRDVELGVYYTYDTLYWLTFFDWGRKKTLHPGYNNFPTPGESVTARRWGWPDKFQVIFWVDGQQVGPKPCGKSGATITQDKVILPGSGLVMEGGAFVPSEAPSLTMEWAGVTLFL
jgi:hypothetical protein